MQTQYFFAKIGNTNKILYILEVIKLAVNLHLLSIILFLINIIDKHKFIMTLTINDFHVKILLLDVAIYLYTFKLHG